MNMQGENQMRERAFEALLSQLSADNFEHGAVEPLDDLAQRRMIDKVLILAAQPSQPQSHAKLYQRLGLIAATVALLALGATVWQGLGQESPPTAALQTPGGEATPTLSGSRFALLVGEVFAGSMAARSGDTLTAGERIETSKGRVVVALPRGIVMSTGDHTRFRVLEPQPSVFEVEFDRGEALFAVEHLQEKGQFIVTTPLGRIEVTGTVFTIVATAGAVEVQLHEGAVTLVEPNGTVRAIASGERAVLGDTATTEIPKVAIQKALVRARELAELELSERVLPLLVEADEAIDAGMDLAVKEPAVRSRPGKRSETRSIKTLMKAARAAKSSGDWLSAARIYEELIASHRASAEAVTSLVSLGQIELNHLGRPAAAHGRFEAYLETPRPGPLACEALYGKARALAALGRRQQERQALEEYVQRYPNGPQFEAARKKLAMFTRTTREPKPEGSPP